MREQRRIGRIAYDPRLPVYLAWDLGGAGGGDFTAIWAFQIYGRERRYLKYWEGNGRSMSEILLSVVPTFGYRTIEKSILPHDARVREYGTGVTRVETAEKL